MKPRFNALCISDSFKAEDEIEQYDWKKKVSSMLQTNNLDVARRFVLARGGQALHTIIVGMGIFCEGSRNEIVGDFLSNCSNAKSLSIAYEKGGWVSTFGGQLEELEIATKEYSLNLRNCMHVRMLNLSLNNEKFVWSGLWECVLERLEVLTLCLSTANENNIEIQNIKTSCPNLRRISIYGMSVLNEDISMSYLHTVIS